MKRGAWGHLQSFVLQHQFHRGGSRHETVRYPVARGNHCACLVEAVGIEPASVHPVSHDSIAITRNGLGAETLLKRSESELPDQLGTRVPNFESIEDLSERVRRVWGALRVV